MVRFVFGGAGAGKSTFVFSEIKGTLESTEKRVCLIVPEQNTVTAESRGVRELPATAALRAEITNFTRLSDSISRRVGGLSYGRLTDGAKQLTVWRAMMSVYDGLSELGESSGSDPISLVPTVYSALCELTMSGIGAKELSDAADDLEKTEGTSSLSRRAHDLALIAAAYNSLEDAELSSLEDPVLKIRDRAAECGYFAGCDVYVDSFYSMTGAQLAALGEIIRLADRVTVTVPMDSADADGVHLAGVRRFYKSVLGTALKRGEIERITLEGSYRTEKESLRVLYRSLWDYSAPESTAGTDGAVSVISVRDRYEEAQALSAFIAQLVRNGARYSDIAVVAADAAALRGVTDAALRSHGIPVFTSDSERVMSSPTVRLILSLLRVVGRWRREDVTAIVKTGLSPLDDTLACAFENYTETWNIRGRAMFSTEWTMNPDGYVERLSERARETLRLANEAREGLISHIESFCDIFENGRAAVRDICVALCNYFEQSGAWERAEQRADTLSPDDAERERLVWGEICRAFDTLVELVPDAVCDSSGFSTLFRYVISDADTGAIPTGIDNVTFTSASGLRTDGIKHVFLLGAVDGEFPAVPSEGGYFSDSDRERLAECGAVFGSTADVRASEELFRFYRAISQATQSLCVFVPKSSNGAACRPSEGALRIMRLTGCEEVSYSELPTELRIFDRDSLDAELRATGDGELRALRESLYGETETRRESITDDTHVSEQTARILFGGRLNLTQSRISSFVKCPMSYYCRYVLELDENKRAAVASPNIGLFVHAVLEQFFTVTAGESYPLSRERTEEICDGIIADYMSRTFTDAVDGRVKYLFIRLRRRLFVFLDAIMEEAAQSRFEIYKTELPIGGVRGESDMQSPPPIRFECADGGTVSLYGILDRLDIYKTDGATYIRVIDYKTGEKRFSFEDVRRGLDVQLLLYLFSAWRSKGSGFETSVTDGEGKILPAGAMYLSLKPNDPVSDAPISAEKARELMAGTIVRSGVVTDERDVLDAMDSGISGKYTPVSLKSDGTYKRCASLASLERFGELYAQLEQTVCGIADEMKSGLAAPRPLEGASADVCEYCPAGEICKKKGRRQ